jgi:N-acyl-D-aspartate/D-glutamate deacylase
MNIGVDGWEDLNGLFITEVARKWNDSPFNTLLKISEKSHGATLMLFHTYSGEPGNERVLETVLSNNQCLFETDALIKSSGYPNPAAMGTFPRILGEYVRKRKLFTLEDAIRRMTSASAERFGLKDRGTLAVGNAADVVVFDPDEISDSPPVGAQPAGKPKGIRHVFINGAHVVDQGSFVADKRLGRVLRT